MHIFKLLLVFIILFWISLLIYNFVPDNVGIYFICIVIGIIVYKIAKQ